jgi:hypothetical protein
LKRRTSDPDGEQSPDHAPSARSRAVRFEGKMKKTTTFVVVFFLVETTELESVTFRV